LVRGGNYFQNWRGKKKLPGQRPKFFQIWPQEVERKGRLIIIPYYFLKLGKKGVKVWPPNSSQISQPKEEFLGRTILKNLGKQGRVLLRNPPFWYYLTLPLIGKKPLGLGKGSD